MVVGMMAMVRVCYRQNGHENKNGNYIDIVSVGNDSSDNHGN